MKNPVTRFLSLGIAAVALIVLGSSCVSRDHDDYLEDRADDYEDYLEDREDDYEDRLEDRRDRQEDWLEDRRDRLEDLYD